MPEEIAEWEDPHSDAGEDTQGNKDTGESVNCSPGTDGLFFCGFSRWHSLILLFDTSEGEEEGDPELSTRELIQQFGLGLRPRRNA